MSLLTVACFVASAAVLHFVSHMLLPSSGNYIEVRTCFLYVPFVELDV